MKRIPKGKKVCNKCGHTKEGTWAFRVNLAAPGAPREMKWGYGFETQKEAQEELDRLRTTKREGTYVKRDRKLTLAAYLDDWLVKAGTLRGWSESAKRDYEGSVRRFIKPKLGHLLLQDLTTPTIVAFYGWLLTSGKVNGTGLSHKSVHNVEICLRSALSFAVKPLKLIRDNPASGAFDFSPSRHRVEMKVWSAEQIDRFLRFTERDEEAVVYRVAALTGMRRGEVLGLRRGDLDLNATHPALNVRQQLTRNGAHLEIVGLKNDSAGWRTIDLDPVTARMLAERKARVATEQLVLGRDYSKLDLIFCNALGEWLDPDVIGRKRKVRAAQAGLPRIRMHDLRHSHATFLLAKGLPLVYVANRLGDKPQTVSDTYAHVIPTMGQDAVRALDAAFNG
ncbi:MAG: tyrosine-type recombinase/integrase [Candidatus Dormibacterales bacterium]